MEEQCEAELTVYILSGEFLFLLSYSIIKLLKRWKIFVNGRAESWTKSKEYVLSEIDAKFIDSKHIRSLNFQ